MGFYNRNSGYIGYVNNSPLGNTKTNNVTSTTATTALLNVNNTPMYTDASTNNQTITPVGLPSTSNSTPFGNGWSTYFDGAGDLLNTPSTSAFDFSTAPSTFEMWIYPTALPGSGNYCRLLRFGANSVSSSFVAFQFTSDGSGAIGVPLTGYTGLGFAAGTVDLNRWQHFAVVLDGTNSKVFKNGSLVASGTVTMPTSANNICYIGYDTPGTVNFNYAGYISNIRVVKGSALYTSNFIPSTAPLTAVSGTSLLACQSSMHVDGSSNNFQLTPSGDARPMVFSPFDRKSFNLAATSASSVSATAAISLATSTSPLTLEAWVKISGNTAGCIISDSYTGGSDAVSFVLGLNDGALNGSTVAGNKPWFGFYSGTSWTGNILVSTTGIPFNEWVHIAGVFTGSTCRIYVNGKLIASGGPSTWTTVASNTVFIGRRWDTSSSAYFNGNIAEARISKELVYSGEFTPPTSPLTAGANTALLVACDGAIIDKSTNRYSLTATGQVWQMKDTPYTYSPIISFTGQSAFFNGTTSYLSVPANANFSFGTGDFTVECWVNYAAVSNTNGKIIADTRPTSTNGSYWVFGVTNTGVAQFLTMTTGGTTITDTQARPNQWVHYAVTRQGTSLRMFANGILVASATDSSNISSDVFNIGKNAFSSGAADTFWSGHISNLRVVKGTALYTANFVAPTAALTAVSGTSILMSVNGIVVGDLTANNLPTVAFNNVANANKSPNTLVNNSIYFDGTGDYATILSNPELTLGTADFTIEFWLYRINAADIGLYDQRLNSNTIHPTIYYQNSTGTIRYYTGAAERISGGFVPQYGWCHVAACRINGVTRLYLDGSQVGADYADTNNYLANPVQLGQFGNTFGGGPFNGYMSGVRVTRGIGLYTGSFIPDNLRTADVNASSSFVLDSGYKTIQDVSFNGSVVYRATSNANVPDVFTPYWPNGQWSNQFNGSTQCLNLSAPAELALGTGDFTIEAWIYKQSTSTTAIIDFRPLFGNGAYPNFYYNGSAVVYYANSADQIVSGSVPINMWHHVAVVRSSGVTKIYVNGIQSGASFTDSNNYTVGSSRPIIGRNGYSDAAYFDGYISNLRIVKGTAVYTANFTPSTTPLTAVSGTSLLTCQSNRFIDNSTNNFAITLTGAPLVKSDNPFVTPTRANSAAYGGSLSMNASETLNLIGDYRPVGDFTVEGWFYVTSYASLRNIFTIGNETTSRISFLMAATTGTISYNVYGGSVISIGGVPTLNQWNHIAIVRSGTTITAYINGTSTGSVTLSGTLGNATNAAFGQPLGYLADQRYTNGRAIYTANFTPPTAMLPTTQTYASQISYYGSGMITNVEKQIDFEKNSVPGLAGKFFNGTDWRTPLPTGNVGTFPLSTTNDSSNVTLTGGLPSNAHRYGVNRYDYIYYLSVGDSYGFIAVGYFKPPVTGSYTFNTSSDDTSGMWIGNVAVLPTGRTSANAIVNNGLGVSAGQGNTKRSGTITLYEGTWYPVRVVHEEGGGGDNLYLTWSGPGIAETSDLSQYFRTPSNGTTLIGHYV